MPGGRAPASGRLRAARNPGGPRRPKASTRRCHRRAKRYARAASTAGRSADAARMTASRMSAAGIVHRAIEHIPLTEAGTQGGEQGSRQDFLFHSLYYA